MKNFKLFALISIVLTLTACGSTPNYYIDKAATSNITSTDVYVTIPQKEIVAEIEQSGTAAAAGGGLLFALIDAAVENSRANDAEELIQPLRDGLVEIDFAEMFTQELEQQLGQIAWLNVRNIVLNKDLTKDLDTTNFASSQSDAVMFVNSSYSISPNFSLLKSSAAVSILPKATGLKQFSEKPESKKAKKSAAHVDNAIYRDSVASVQSINGTSNDMEQNAQIISQQIEAVKASYKTLAKNLAEAVAVSVNNTRSSADSE